MRLRSALILLLLAAGLGAYAYFVERPAREQAAEKPRLLTVDRDAVEEITLTYPEREIRLTKDADGHWKVTAPRETDADQTVVTNLLGAIADAELTKTIEEPPQDLALYGLDQPTVTIRLRLTDGPAPPALVVGKQTPIGFKAYVQREGDPKVYLTTGAFHSGVKKELKDLRDKTVIDFVDDEVRGIELVRDGGPALTLRRDDGAWRITAPGEHAADAAEVRGFLSSLRGLRAQDFIDAPSGTAATYGLEPPRLRVTLSVGTEAEQQSVLLGGDAPGTPKRIYARRGERDTIYLVGEWTLASLDKDLAKFRDRTVLPFEPEAPAQITITRRTGENPLRLERPSGGPWSVAGQHGTLKESAINRFIDDLRQTKPAEIVSDAAADLSRYGLDDPELTISVVGAEGKPIGTILATRGPTAEPDTGEEYYFARAGRPTIYRDRQYMFQRLDKRPSDFVEAAAAPPDDTGTAETPPSTASP